MLRPPSRRLTSCQSLPPYRRILQRRSRERCQKQALCHSMRLSRRHLSWSNQPRSMAQPRFEAESDLLIPRPESVPQPEPESVSGPRHGAADSPLRRAWSHRTTKLSLAAVVAVVAVFAILWGIRMAHKSPSDTPSATAATQPTSNKPAHAAFVLPVTQAQMTQYEHYAQGLQKANAAAVKAFVRSGAPRQRPS